MRRWLISVSAATLLAAACAHAAPAPAGKTLRPSSADAPREYEDATILIIDKAAGWIGLSVPDPRTGVETKLTFRVDPSTVSVTNPQSQELEFDALKEGDVVDVYTEPDGEGSRRVVEILSYSRFAED